MTNALIKTIKKNLKTSNENKYSVAFKFTTNQIQVNQQ